MRIYLKKHPAKFHPDLIWNTAVLCCFWKGRHKKKSNNNSKKKNKMSVDMRWKNVVFDVRFICFNWS